LRKKHIFVIIKKKQMANQQISNTFTQLPPWAKGVVVVGVLAGAAYALHKISTLPKNIKEGKGSRDQENAEIKEQQQLQQQGKKATLTKSQMASIANVVFNAVDGWGTDEDAIITQMKKIKNDLDYLGVSTAWGIREVSSGRFNPEPNFKGTLAGALQNDLSNYWIRKINTDFYKKKMTYRV